MLQQYSLIVAFIMIFGGVCGMILRTQFLVIIYCGFLSFLGLILLIACFFSPHDKNTYLICAIIIICATVIFSLCAQAYVLVCRIANRTLVAEFRKLRG